MTGGQSLGCATWNIHRARGSDGRVNPGRIADLIETRIAPHGPDVLALQEADEECRPHRRVLDVARISKATGLDYAHEDARLRWGPESDGFLGTILFLHPRLTQHHTDVIDLPGHCHRGAIAAEVEVDGRMVRIASAHLSLSQPLRLIQMRIFGQYLRRRPAMQTIFLGDFNEWRPWRSLMFHRRLVGARFSGPVRRSFPSACPVLPLDRIVTDAPGGLVQSEVLKGRDLSAASDHLPLVGRVGLA